MDALPEQYSAWIREALGAPLPSESKATCPDCAMCGEWTAAGVRFKPDVKCCSFTPALPNFRVGAVLADPDPALERGRETVRARIRARDGATPLSLNPPRAYALVYAKLSRAGFGRDRSLLCPHYDDGRCSIWRWREAVCATYFCRFDRGEGGRSVWRSARRLLLAVEAAVARWCALQAGMDGHALQALVVLDEAGREGSVAEVSSPERVERAWGAWLGREEEFYARCWEGALGLGWKDVLRLSGSEGDMLARALWHRFHEDLPPDLPPRLRLKGYTLAGGRDRTVWVTGYSESDPLELDRDAATALARFDGRPVEAVLDEIARRDGVRLSPELLQALLDHRILVPDRP